MKLLIDTEWFDILQDLPEEKRVEVMGAILSYPNGNSDTNLWRKVILPKLQQQESVYNKKVQVFAENRQKRYTKKSEQISTQISMQKSEQISDRCENVIVNEDVNVIDKNIVENVKKKNTTREKDENKSLYVEIKNFLTHNLSKTFNREFPCRGWTDDIRKLCELDKVSPERVMDALRWHFSHLDREYCLEIQSAKALREKFSRLEAQMKRAESTEEKPFYL